MEEVYSVLWDLEYPKALVPNLRQKIDYMRRIIEETHHDIFIAEAMR
jgi:Predicted RNA-binding protein of the translin family